MSHYDVLGVAPSAPTAEVRRAYLSLARRHHPDRHAEAGAATRAEAERTMQRVNEAWLVLGDRARRAAYDEALWPTTAGPAAPSAADQWVPGTVHPDFVPVDDSDDEDPRYADIDLDDTAYGPSTVPRWQQLLPVGLLASAIGALCVGLVINLVPLMTLGLFLLVASGVGFILTPVFAIMRSARHE